MNNEMNKLAATVADESQPLAARRQAAEHYIKLTMDEVPNPSDDDPEVMELRKPWTDVEIAKLFSGALGSRPLKRSLPDAKNEVRERHKLRAVLSVVADESAHRLLRIAACGSILNLAHPQWFYNRNSYSPEKLLNAAKPATSVKWTSRSLFNGPEPVQRPPIELSDLWDS